MTSTILVPAWVPRLDAALGRVEPPPPPLARPFRLLLSGSRKAEREVWLPVLESAFRVVAAWSVAHGYTGVQLIHGDAVGIDRYGHETALRLRVAATQAGHPHAWRKPSRWPVTREMWNQQGRRAGINRNHRMIHSECPDLTLAVLAHGDSRGTRDAMAWSVRCGIPVACVTVEDLYLPHVPRHPARV